MPDKDPETGKFVTSKPKPTLSHPALRPPKKKKRTAKQRRTIVRTIKLVNPFNESPALVEVPIEPSHNNRGALGDPTIPARHYLEKGFILPHEFDGKVIADDKEIDLQVIFCAVSGCWAKATVTDDQENGTERCVEHETMFRTGEIRYATSAKG